MEAGSGCELRRSWDYYLPKAKNGDISRAQADNQCDVTYCDRRCCQYVMSYLTFDVYEEIALRELFADQITFGIYDRKKY